MIWNWFFFQILTEQVANINCFTVNRYYLCVCVCVSIIRSRRNVKTKESKKSKSQRKEALNFIFKSSWWCFVYETRRLYRNVWRRRIINSPVYTICFVSITSSNLNKILYLLHQFNLNFKFHSVLFILQPKRRNLFRGVVAF